MRAVIVCGAREALHADWYDAVGGALGFDRPMVVIHGACGMDADERGRGVVADRLRGIDGIVHAHAAICGWPVLAMPAPWARMGKTAGPTRNRKMMEVLLGLGFCGYAVGVLAFHDDLEHGSRGTKHMVQHARFAGVPYEVRNRNGDVYDRSPD